MSRKHWSFDDDPDARQLHRQLTRRRVAECQRAEAALRRSEQYWRALFDQAPEAMLLTTHEGVVRDLNAAACRLYGVAKEALLGQRVCDLALADHYPVADQSFLRLARGEIDCLEGACTTADGRMLSLSIRVSRIESAEAPALLVYLRDITERKQLELQLLQAQKLESIGRLASGVAHDFNNLLTVIGGYASLALEELPSAAPLYSDLNEIRIVVERAGRLTHQLLAFARHQAIESQLLNLNDLILDLATMLRRLIGDNIELAIAPGPEMALINADHSQIEQLLVNLVVNARDAMPEGGKLSIKTCRVAPGHPMLQNYLEMSPAGAVCLTVSDTGVGMDDIVKGRLFELFYTTKALGRGTGLGLATCYGIVKQHGGHIEVDSEVGRGTTFSIYLPAASRATP
ncbi:MAG TPA: ATP-binding protein [Roseiflexaceae bacterium]|nr:ATP-binding protein [Roseiflexaceae bacterium]